MYDLNLLSLLFFVSLSFLLWWWHLANENVACGIYARASRKMKNMRVGIQPLFSKSPKQKSNGVIISERLIQLVSSLVRFKKKKVM